MTSLGVSSEVGRLRVVLLHQPGHEHRRTVPWNKDALLFDDILDIEEARPQHKRFSQALATHGVEVLFLTDLLKDVCRTPAARHEVVREVLSDVVLPDDALAQIRHYDLISGFPGSFHADPASSWEPLPNLYFMRDPAFGVPGAIVIAHPFWPARRREASLVAAVMKRHPRFADAVVYDGILRDPAARIEGGDVEVVDEENVIIGIGERTNNEGADHLARFLFANTPVRRVFKLFIPAKREFMHLDTVMTFVDRGQLLTMPFLWDRPDVYSRIAIRSREQCQRLGIAYRGPDPDSFQKSTWLEVWTRDGLERRFEDELHGLEEFGLIDGRRTVTVAGASHAFASAEEHVTEALREQWNDAANVLAIKPGQVLSYSCNDRTVRELESAGIEVIPFVGSELVRGRGGPRCMSMPLLRDAV